MDLGDLFWISILVIILCILYNTVVAPQLEEKPKPQDNNFSKPNLAEIPDGILTKEQVKEINSS